MEQTQRDKIFLDRRLERACGYVSDMWFPASAAITRRVREKLRSGHYDQAVPELLADLRGDFSLYIYCLRELGHLLHEEGAPALPDTTPEELIARAGLERLRLILELEDESISAHSFEGMNEFQHTRLNEALLSARTVEVLADEAGLDSGMSFSIALLRQLGLTLIAWNYPGVYEKATLSLGQYQTLDEAIAAQLGYSPALLGIRLARSWHLPLTMVAAIDPDAGRIELGDDAEYSQLIDAAARTFSTICRVGEALSRANNPSLYPRAEQDWSEARLEIARRLGDDGLAIIRAHFRRSCEKLIDASPQVFRIGITLDPEARFLERRYTALIDQNRFIPQCRPPLQRRLVALYGQLARLGSVSSEHLDYFAREVIPAGGFTAGCVYTIEPALQKLIPQLRINQLRCREAKSVPLSSTADPLVAALDAQAPLIEEVALAHGSIVTLTGAVGLSQRVGVIYLELPRQVFAEDAATHLIHCQALIQGLNDCLRLS